MYNVHIILEDDMKFVVHSDLGPKVKVRKMFFKKLAWLE